MSIKPAQASAQLSLRQIITTWWPLAASWLLMGVEVPLLSAVIARLQNPEVHLAAFGGVVFPLALIVESPIIMLLAGSTALSKDWASYALIRRYMMVSGALLTLLHILIAFTPLYFVVAEDILGVPPEIIEPARLGLMIMVPWTWSIAYRRFNQGVLIRFGYSKAIGVGTVVRLSTDVLVLAIGYQLSQNLEIPGIAVGTAAQAISVISEAFYVRYVVRPVLNSELKAAPSIDPPLTWMVFWAFYLPLVMTSLITLLANPIGSAAVSRMPQALISLAVWPVINGFIFVLRSLGVAYNEVVVALLDRPGASINLKRFANLLAGFTTLALVLVAATQLSTLWFGKISALSPELVNLAKNALWLALPLPALSVIQSWYQGALLYGRHTRGITESVVVYLLTFTVVQWTGVIRQQMIGLDVALLATSLAATTQTTWLWLRCRPILESLRQRDR